MRLLAAAVAFGFVAAPVRATGFLEKLGIKPSSDSASTNGLAQGEIASGLKEALASGIKHAVTNLGQPDGFLKDASVRIPLPGTLQKTESTLRKFGAGKQVDDFEATMNHAAEQAVPQSIDILLDALKQMTISDAASFLKGTNASATEYFKKTTSAALHEKFLPDVKQATEKTGVTSSYKSLMEKATSYGSLSALGKVSWLKDSTDIDSYVTDRSIDGLFKKIAEQETQIRANPAARTTELLQKVFGSITGPGATAPATSGK
jgi:hypothetical protein